MSNKQFWTLICGPLLAAIIATSMSFSGWHAEACWAAAIVMLCVIWWIFEPIPIPATSLIPITFFPITGVLSKEEVAKSFGNDLILLML